MMDLHHKRALDIAVFFPANPHCTCDILEFDRISQRGWPTGGFSNHDSWVARHFRAGGDCSSVFIAFRNHDRHGRMEFLAIAH
jgi:hypothetical protein